MKQLIKTTVSWGIRLGLRVFHLFPIRQNRVFFSAYSGAQYACSPKYISEYLADRHPQLEIVWCRKGGAFPSIPGATLVSFGSLSYFYHLLTARVVVLNDLQNASYLPFRKRQYVIQTWHGCGLYKKVGRDTPGNTVWNDRRLRRTIRCISCFLSGARAFSETIIRGAFGYTGEIREIGLPRNDMLLSAEKTTEIGHRVREELGLSANELLVMYAPTFRRQGENSAHTPDFDKILTACETRFGRPARLLLRSHYLPETRLCAGNRCVDVSDYPDMQPLLCAADILLTDYSSSIWDFGLTGKPCFLYAPDLADYRTDRDFYLDIHRWPFPLAETSDDLCARIAAFEPTAYAEALANHYNQLGSAEQGAATKQIGEEIARLCQ